MNRYAIIERPSGDDGLERVRAYLPRTYVANRVGTFDRRIMISGHDDAGWTLDGYVIPRLASGLIFAREVDAAEREVILEQAQIEDEMTADELRGITAPDY